MARAFGLGLTTGLVYFGGTLYWVTHVIAVYGGLPTGVAVAVNVAFVAYLALFPAIFAMVVSRLIAAFGAVALLTAPAVWVATELGRGQLFTGFPWVLLGYSQARVLPIAQLASIFGVYGVSALVAAVSAVAAHWVVTRPMPVRSDAGSAAGALPASGHGSGVSLRSPAALVSYVVSGFNRTVAYVVSGFRLRRKFRWAVVAVDEALDRMSARLLPGFNPTGRAVSVLAMAVLILVVGLWGSSRAAGAAWTRTGESIRVGLVQGNVDQEQKWSADRAGAIFRDYLRMTEQAMAQGADLVVWPESSTPFYFEEDRASADMVRSLARQARVPILLGSDQIARAAIDSALGSGSAERADQAPVDPIEGAGVPAKYYNSAFLVGADGSTGGVYRKMHLVPFGEYIPLKRLFFFAAPLVQSVSDFSAGETPTLLPVGQHLISTAICYEIVYPDLVRRFVRGGSELLTTITNDAWFGRTSAPYQHFAQASMRAIEQGRYLVRAANTGISGIVDPYGRVVGESAIFEPVVMVGEARFLRTTTIYSRTGDVFAYATVAVTIALLVLSRRRRPSTPGKQ